jgi:hypothetical protein
MAFSDISMQILRQGLQKTKGFSGAASACPAPALQSTVSNHRAAAVDSTVTASSRGVCGGDALTALTETLGTGRRSLSHRGVRAAQRGWA